MVKGLLASVAGLMGCSLAPARAVEPPPAATVESQPAPGGAEPSATERARRWEEDLKFLAEEFPAKHKNAFFKCTREQWEARVAAIRAKLPGLSDVQALVELRQLVALIGDGHSNIWQDGQSTVAPFRMYPVACAWLADGVYPAVLPREHEALIGQKLIRVGGHPIDEVIERLARLQGSDNESGRKEQVMAALRQSEAVAALGIVANIDAAEFTLADAEGHETTITVGPLPVDANQAALLSQKPEPAKLGLTRRHRRPPYGHELMADSKTLYVWYDTCADSGDKKVSEFCEETLKAIDAGLAASPATIERVVVDLRRNGGGNSMLFTPMIEGLARREEINKKGKLFALIGRRTFSSGMMNAYQLTNATKCQLVGEPTGGSPNGYGEVKQFRLPNSKLVVQYSTKLFKGPVRGDSVKPTIDVPVDSRGYFDPARDAVLEAAIAK